MKLKQTVWVILVVLLRMSAYGQGLKLSDNPDTFLTEFGAVLTASANPQAAVLQQNFEKNWNTLSRTQQSGLATAASLMLKKGYKSPQFVPLAETFNQALSAGLNGSTLDGFIETFKKTVELTDMKTTMSLLAITKSFYTNKSIYASNYNRLYVLAGSLSFQYNEQKIDLNADAPPKPTATTPTATPPATQTNSDGWDDAPAKATSPRNDPWDDTPLPTPQNGTAAPVADLPPPMFINAGPTLVFTGANLTIATSSDSVTMLGTNATLGIKEGVLVGKGGQFTWENVGHPEIFVKLDSYSMEIKNARVRSESATLTYSDKLQQPVKGIFEFQSKKRAANTPASYPRFMSYKNDVVLKGISDFEYQGGISLMGNKLSSTSLREKYSSITINQAGKPLFRFNARQFEINDSLIVSPAATFTGYFADNDSLYHPLVKVTYHRLKQALRLSKVEAGGFRESNYLDSYHKLEIFADAVNWQVKEQKIDFSILVAKNIIPALFESYDYYNPQRFNSIAEAYNFNPLIVVSNYAKKNNLSEVRLSEMAKAYQKDLNSIKPIFLSMMQKGYFEYDPEIEKIKLSRKGNHYLAVLNNKKDYDNFLIPSYYASNAKDSSANASLRLTDNILLIRGVKQFYLSDSLNVYMAPYDNLIKVNKDRNFGISGELKTGNFRFRGKDLSFNYADFSVKINKIDSITFIPQKELAKKGRTEIGGDLKYESGTLYINMPENKSGRQRRPEFPRLVIPTGVTAYFDQSYRKERVYDRKVYFKVPSIDFDSLNIKDIDFVGMFHSDGIFPSFKETLVSMPDNSLGFVHKVPEGKYILYNSRSFMKFNSPIVMDKKGLHSDGELNHLTAQIQAKEMYFAQDSARANGSMGLVNEGTIGQAFFTKVAINNYSLLWKPKVDSMMVESKGGQFDLYSGSTRLEGKLLVRQSGLFGLGKVLRNDSQTQSDFFKFGKELFTAEMAKLMVGDNLRSAKPALYGKYLQVKFNLAQGKVTIETAQYLSKGDSTSLFLPYTAYKTSINIAEWDMNKKTISMRGDVQNSVFTSVEPSQNGLYFNASDAVYNMEQQSLFVNGVPHIFSADAKIFPDRGQVTIKRDAEMQPLVQAKLIVDTLTGYHKMIDGTIKITSKNKFEGDATYQFVNINRDTINIKMGNFELKEVASEDRRNKKAKSFITTARATVIEKDKFHISPKVLYKGDIVMIANEPSLKMEGWVKPETPNRKDVISWIPYRGKSTDDAQIDVSPTLKDDLNTTLVAGLHHKTAAAGIYTTFFTNKQDTKDEDIFLAKGPFRDVPNSKRFEIGSSENEKSYEATRYTYDDASKTVTLEGGFNLFQLNNYIQTTGFAEIRLDSNSYKFDQMFVVNFPVPSDVLKIMADKIIKQNVERTDLESADDPDEKERLLSKIANVIGGKTVASQERKLKNEHVALHTLSSKLNTTFVLSKVNLRYSEANSAFYSVGTLGVSSVGAADINAQMKGYLEVRKANDGDEFYLYLEPSDDLWFYVGFYKNELGIVSSDADFNAVVTSKTKSNKKGNGKNAYTFLPVEAEEKISFIERFTDNYRNKAERKKRINTEEKPQEKKKEVEKEKDGF